MHTKNLLAIAAIAGLATSAVAQDSISNAGTGLPGDAPDAGDAADQINRYVVDLVPFSTSFGTEFGIGVVAKAPNTDGPAGFFNNLTSAQAISQTAGNRTYTNVSFGEWIAAPGVGVDANNTAPANSVDLNGNFWQQAVAFNTFGGNNQTGMGAIIAMDRFDSSRLFVTRTIANTNQEFGAPNPGNLFQSGFGGVDFDGNSYWRLDDFGTGNSTSFMDVSGNNWIRVALQDRSPIVNTVHDPSIIALDAAATDALLVNSGLTHSVPQALPADVFNGARGRIAGPNFSSQYVYGDVLPLASTSAHILSADHRGGIGYTPATWAGFSNPGVATLAITQGPSGFRAEVATWSVDADGNVLDTNLLTPNSLLVDRCTTLDGNPSTDVVVNIAAGNYSGVHHSSQAAFRGGSGQAAVHVDPVSGDLLGALVITANDDDDSSANVMYSIREDTAGNQTQTLVAYNAPVTQDGNGVPAGPKSSEILDGVGGSRIGQLVTLSTLTGGSPSGPSMSAPSFDSAGNIWFTASYVLDATPNDPDSGLFRAVWDRANHCYDLELVASLGDVFTGINSGVPFQIQFISIADGNSISSGAFFSSNATKNAVLGEDLSIYNGGAGLPNVDPRTNGGVILAAEIVFDADLDGDFEDPTGSSGNPNSNDESYQALLYIGALTEICPADLNRDGLGNGADIGAFVNAFTGNDPIADVNGDNLINGADIGEFVNLFAAGCP